MPEDTIDRLLKIISAYSPEFGAGFSNHAPMTMGALLKIAPGAGEGRLESLVAAAVEKLEPWPENTTPINLNNIGDALGDPLRLAGWRDFFVRLTERAGWRDTLAEWAPRLLPGVMAGATHGLIRTAYAADYLMEADTPVRRMELCIALAYWAARFQSLPDGEGNVISDDPAALLGKIARLPEGKRVKGLIFERVGPLGGFEPFKGARAALDVSNPGEALNRISKAAASLYLQNDGRPAITFIHCLTASHAVRMIARVLPKTELPGAVSYLWQAVAGLYCADSDAPWDSGYAPSRDSAEERLSRGGWDAMLSIAARVNTDHVIKYAWSALDENRANPDPVYLAALARWLVRSGVAK